MHDPNAHPRRRDPAEDAIEAFVAARSAGDEDGMKRAWHTFVLTEIGRVRNIIRTWGHDDLPGRRVPRDARDDVEHDVMLRLLAWIKLRGSSVGEAKAMVAKHTDYALKEYARQYVKDDARRKGSLDAPGADGEGPGAVAQEAQEQAAGRRPDDIELAEMRQAWGAAFEQVDENKREVVLLRAAGFSGDEVAERLGLSRANVDQRNKRGLEQLRAALGDVP